MTRTNTAVPVLSETRTTRRAVIDNDLRPSVRLYVTAAVPTLAPMPIEIRFRTKLMARSATAWADATRAMSEARYVPGKGQRYRVDFINHVDGITIAQMPSCMNKAVDGIADALGCGR